MILKVNKKQSFTISSESIFFEMYSWGYKVDFFFFFEWNLSISFFQISNLFLFK